MTPPTTTQTSRYLVSVVLLVVGTLEAITGILLLLPTLWLGGSTFSDKYITHTPSGGFFDFSDETLLFSGSAILPLLAPALGGLVIAATAALLLLLPNQRRGQRVAAAVCVVVPLLLGVASFATPFLISSTQRGSRGPELDVAAALGASGAAISAVATSIGVVMAALVVWTHRRAGLPLDEPLLD